MKKDKRLDVKEFAKGQWEALKWELLNALLLITAVLVRSNGNALIIGANGVVNKEKLPQLKDTAGTFITSVMLTQYNRERIVAVGLIGRLNDDVLEVVSLIVKNMKESGIESVFMPGYIGYSEIKVPMTYICGTRGNNLEQPITQIRGPVFFNGDSVIFTHGKEAIEAPMSDVLKGNWSASIKRLGNVEKDITALTRGTNSSIIINTVGKYYELNLEKKDIKPFTLPEPFKETKNTAFFTFTESRELMAAIDTTGQLIIEKVVVN